MASTFGAWITVMARLKAAVKKIFLFISYLDNYVGINDILIEDYTDICLGQYSNLRATVMLYLVFTTDFKELQLLS